MYQFIDMDCDFVIIFCSIFSKATEPFDFIKHNIIQNSAYMVRYISQIDRDLMFFTGSTLRFFNYVGTIVNNMERINTRKRNTINTVQSVQSVNITFVLLKCYRSIDNSIEFYLFILS